MVNVWDFYSNGRCPREIEKEKRSAAQKDMANYERAYNRLSKLIEVNRGGQTESSTTCVSVPREKKRSVSVSGTIKNEKVGSISGGGCGSSNICKRLYSQINVIGEIKDVRVKIDHSQVLFLLRLVDTIDLFTKQLKKDSEHTLQFKVTGF